MDRLIYIAMTGAKNALWQQASTAHNLANASTTGFRAELNAFRALPVTGPGAATRAFAVDSTIGADFTPGVLQQTGRSLDVAINGRGWIAVQDGTGREAYTRSGGLQIAATGVLQTRDGLPVLGDSGPITVPPDATVTIGRDGTVSTAAAGASVAAPAIAGRIKLVNPSDAALEKGADGLFRQRDGNLADTSATVTLSPGALENSNVNVVDAMTSMISQSRQFEMHIKLLQTADANARSSSQLLNMNG